MSESLFILTMHELDWLTREVQRCIAELDALYDGLSEAERHFEERRLMKSGMALLRKRREESIQCLG